MSHRPVISTVPSGSWKVRLFPERIVAVDVWQIMCHGHLVKRTKSLCTCRVTPQSRVGSLNFCTLLAVLANGSLVQNSLTDRSFLGLQSRWLTSDWRCRMRPAAAWKFRGWQRRAESATTDYDMSQVVEGGKCPWRFRGPPHCCSGWDLSPHTTSPSTLCTSVEKENQGKE